MILGPFGGWKVMPSASACAFSYSQLQKMLGDARHCEARRTRIIVQQAALSASESVTGQDVLTALGKNQKLNFEPQTETYMPTYPRYPRYDLLHESHCTSPRL